MASAGVRVEGLRELNRSLSRVNRTVGKIVRDELKQAAEPVRATAESYATQRITNIGGTWPAMRTGSTIGTVYVAPKARNRGGSPRSNLGVLLFEQMSEALDRETPGIVRKVEQALDNMAIRAGF